MTLQWIVAASLAVLGIAGTTAQTVEAANEGGGQLELCVLTIDCGGVCGNRGEINAFLAQCYNGPVGPCFSDCWNACLHASGQGNSDHLSACTLQCAHASCPDDAGVIGLVHAGHAECPPPDPAVTCLAVYDPVDCAGCIYSNACVADGAGFNVASCEDLGDPPVILP